MLHAIHRVLVLCLWFWFLGVCFQVGSMLDTIMSSTHVQAFFVDADHHPRVLTLHTEANVQNALRLLGLAVVLPGPLVEGGGQRHGWREGKGQTGASQSNSRSWVRTGVAQDGQLWRKHALQRIHHIWKSHTVRSSWGWFYRQGNYTRLGL